MIREYRGGKIQIKTEKCTHNHNKYVVVASYQDLTTGKIVWVNREFFPFFPKSDKRFNKDNHDAIDSMIRFGMQFIDGIIKEAKA